MLFYLDIKISKNSMGVRQTGLTGFSAGTFAMLLG
jgi:hypothetical protein